MKQINKDVDFFCFLRKRSLLGLIYRRFYLYPRLVRYLDGMVLDVGCGIGDFVSYRPCTIGIDTNFQNIEYCHSRDLKVFYINDAFYPFPDHFFDGAIMDNVLEHLDEPFSTLAEVRRVLKPSATLIVGVPGIRGYAYLSDHKRYYDEKDLVNCLKEAKFYVNKVLHMPFKSRWLDKNMRQYCLYGIFKCK